MTLPANVVNLLQPDDIDFAHYLRSTDTAHKVRSAADYEAAVREAFDTSREPAGVTLPWAKTHDDIRLRPGEVSLWAGVNGHGKSLLLGQVVLWLMRQHKRTCVASFEMKPFTTLARMVRQASGGRHPASPFIGRFFGWARPSLWVYDQQGTVDADKLIAVVRYCQDRLGIEHFVIDSLMKCVKGEDDYNGQKNFLDVLTAVARDTGMHIHLVHHIRKQGDESKPGGKMDLKGSGAITDQADNVFIVWRNKAKEFAAKAGQEHDATEPDAMLICDKQRNGEWEGRIALWFDAASQQYQGVQGGMLQEYVR